MVQNGSLFLVDNNKNWEEAKARVTMQQSARLTKVSAVDAQTLFSEFPWVNQGKMVSANLCPSDRFLLPHVVYNEGARLAREAGVTLIQNAAVIGATHARSGKLSLAAFRIGRTFQTTEQLVI
jgi:hypothetical protein